MSDELQDETRRQAMFAAGGALASAVRRIEKARHDLIFGRLADFDMIRGQIAIAERDLVESKAFLVTASHGLDVAAVQYGAKLMEGAHGPAD